MADLLRVASILKLAGGSEGHAEVYPPPAEVLKFLKKKPSPEDKELHGWSEQQGIEPEETEEVAYALLGNVLSGGKSKGNDPKGLDQGEVAKGIEVEKEHTDVPQIARKIALDHLVEHPRYYTALDAMEKALKEGKSSASWSTKKAFDQRLARVTSLLTKEATFPRAVARGGLRGALYGIGPGALLGAAYPWISGEGQGGDSPAAGILKRVAGGVAAGMGVGGTIGSLRGVMKELDRLTEVEHTSEMSRAEQGLVPS